MTVTTSQTILLRLICLSPVARLIWWPIRPWPAPWHDNVLNVALSYRSCARWPLMESRSRMPLGPTAWLLGIFQFMIDTVRRKSATSHCSAPKTRWCMCKANPSIWSCSTATVNRFHPAKLAAWWSRHSTTLPHRCFAMSLATGPSQVPCVNVGVGFPYCNESSAETATACTGLHRPAGRVLWAHEIDTQPWRQETSVIDEQFVQDASGAVELKFASPSPLTPAQDDQLRQFLQAAIGDDVPISVSRHTSIERSPNGKLERIISQAKP